MPILDILKKANPVTVAIDGVNAIKDIFDEFNFSEEEKAKAGEALKKIEAGVAIVDATGHSVIQRTARPATIWMWNGTLITMLWINYIISPVMVWWGKEAIYAPIPDLVWVYSAAVTGLANVVYFLMRTAEKKG